MFRGLKGEELEQEHGKGSSKSPKDSRHSQSHNRTSYAAASGMSILGGRHRNRNGEWKSRGKAVVVAAVKGLEGKKRIMTYLRS